MTPPSPRKRERSVPAEELIEVPPPDPSWSAVNARSRTRFEDATGMNVYHVDVRRDGTTTLTVGTVNLELFIDNLDAP